MFYNDKETEESEKNFQKNLITTREFMAAEMETMDEQIAIIVNDLTELLANPNKSPEDLESLKGIRNQLLPIMQTFQDMQNILNESLLRQTTVFYHHVKKLAAEGNEEARKAYEGLKPAYEEMLAENISNN